MSDKSIISKYRTELMGLSALMILIVHSVGFVEWPVIINKIFSYGGVGVYCFIYLSAMGLTYSMRTKKNLSPRKILPKKINESINSVFFDLWTVAFC